MLNFGVVLNAILLVLGILWCVAVFRRFREDWHDVRHGEIPEKRNAIVFYWVLTVVVILLIVNFALGLLGL